MENKFAGVIFDFDGTVIDNEGNWETAFVNVMTKLQIPNPKLVQPNGWVHEPGAGLMANWKRLVSNDQDIEKFSRETVLEYISQSKDVENIMVRDGLDELVEQIKEMGKPVALCTGNHWYMVEEELERLQMYLAFDITTTGEEVLMQKPDPEIYLLTIQKLGVDPVECLVIEDAICGVRAAVEAGCQVAGLVSDYAPRELLLSAGAKWAIEDLKEISGLISE